MARKSKVLILASGSSKRSQILSSCGIRHKAIKSNIRETLCPGRTASYTSMKNAEVKARCVAEKKVGDIVIGCDTVVMVGGRIIGKPKDSSYAKKWLRKFSGSSVDVYTGLFVIDVRAKRFARGFARSRIKVKRLRGREVDRYFDLLGPYDKAGGFSIEGLGSLIFDDIKGSYFNILGLPLAKLNELLGKIGHDLLDFVRA